MTPLVCSSVEFYSELNKQARWLLLIFYLLKITVCSGQQMGVLFSDDLETRAQTIKIKTTSHEFQGNKYASMKLGKVRLVNLIKKINLDTLSFSQEKVKAPLMALFDKNHSVFGKGSMATKVNAEFSVAERISFDLIDGLDFRTSIIANRVATKRVNRAISSGGTFQAIQDTPDTSYVEATIIAMPNQIEPYTAKLFFQGEGSKCIIGVVLCGADSIMVRTTNKAKKYNALGVELVYKEKVIAGLQLPDMHIGPSFILVDNNLSFPLNRVSFSILALVLYVNENR